MTAFTLNAYDHDGILLNLYGERDEDGCEIEIVTAADSAIDLTALFPASTLRSMEEKADAQMCREAKAQRGEAAIDEFQMLRDERAELLRALQY